LLTAVPAIKDWNFDLDDRDNILRIEATNIPPGYIESLLQTAGFARAGLLIAYLMRPWEFTIKY